MTSSIVIAIIVGVIVTSMIFATYMYWQYRPNLVLVEAGEAIKVGPVMYTVRLGDIHMGDPNTPPEEVFFQILITAENVGTENTKLSGGQFYLLDENDKKYRPVYGNFTEEDLFNEILEPNVLLTRTTQFDIPYDEQAKYRIGILPTKSQSSTDIGIVCVMNCHKIINPAN